MKKQALITLLFLSAAPLLLAAPSAETSAEQASLSAARHGLQSLVERAQGSSIFVGKQDGLLNPEERDEVRRAWASFLDCLVALNSIEQKRGVFFERKSLETAHQDFPLAYPSYLATYRWSLAWIEQAERNSQIPILLNEANAEAGFPRGTYDALKFKALNVAAASRFAAYTSLSTAWKINDAELTPGATEDAAALWKSGTGKGEIMTAQNALAVLRGLGKTAWFPVQADVANWMGDVKVARRNEVLITPEQISALQKKLEPGDIFLERHEWYLSNVGLPGFWTHAAIYVGTSAERRAYFDDKDVHAWVRAQGEPSGNLETLLKRRFPDAAASSVKATTAGDPRVLEAIGEGVLFSPLERAAAADSLAALRPRRTKTEKAQALLRAFGYAGRPYDFDFDFVTDAALVCSELVYKSYQPSTGYRGVSLPLSQVLGRPLLPPNDIARLMDEKWDSSDRSLDLIVFLDGHEREKRAVVADDAAFRSSWRRPKWHVFE